MSDETKETATNNERGLGAIAHIAQLANETKDLDEVRKYIAQLESLVAMLRSTVDAEIAVKNAHAVAANTITTIAQDVGFEPVPDPVETPAG